MNGSNLQKINLDLLLLWIFLLGCSNEQIFIFIGGKWIYLYILEIGVNMYNLCYADLAKIKQKEYLENKVQFETKKNVVT